MLMLAMLQNTWKLCCKTSESFHNVDNGLMATHVQGYAPLYQQVVFNSDFHLHEQHSVLRYFQQKLDCMQHGKS